MTLTQSDAIEHLQRMKKKQEEKGRERKKTHMIKNQLKIHSLAALLFCENEDINFSMHYVCLRCVRCNLGLLELVKIFNQLHESA